jgi:carbohydrate kinase (thermoresistant glucokinase family)
MVTGPRAATTAAAPVIVVGGVSGSGKTSVGEQLALALGVPFVDGDHLHPPENVHKMSGGVPLDDNDRAGWLDLIGAELAAQDAGGLVIACSALKRAYRERIHALQPRTQFVMLTPNIDVLRQRLAARKGHFMPPALLDSQLDTLEPLAPEERGTAVASGGSVQEIVERVLAGVGLDAV